MSLKTLSLKKYFSLLRRNLFVSDSHLKWGKVVVGEGF